MELTRFFGSAGLRVASFSLQKNLTCALLSGSAAFDRIKIFSFFSQLLFFLFPVGSGRIAMVLIIIGSVGAFSAITFPFCVCLSAM